MRQIIYVVWFVPGYKREKSQLISSKRICTKISIEFIRFVSTHLLWMLINNYKFKGNESKIDQLLRGNRSQTKIWMSISVIECQPLIVKCIKYGEFRSNANSQYKSNCRFEYLISYCSAVNTHTNSHNNFYPAQKLNMPKELMSIKCVRYFFKKNVCVCRDGYANTTNERNLCSSVGRKSREKTAA